LSILKLGEDAYIVALRRHMKDVTGKSINHGSLCNTLSALIRKGYVRSAESDPEPRPGGRRKILYSLTAEGKRALLEAYKVQKLAWDGLVESIVEAEAEVEKCAWACDYYAEHTGHFLAPDRRALEGAVAERRPDERDVAEELEVEIGFREVDAVQARAPEGRALDRDPDFPVTNLFLGQAYVQKSRFQEAGIASSERLLWTATTPTCRPPTPTLPRGLMRRKLS
jgi:DNA-binding PadR family transcriptional regulator